MLKEAKEALGVSHSTMPIINQVLTHLNILQTYLEVPDGGSGGNGGDVYFRSTGRISSLYDLRRAHFFGNDGKYGQVRSIHRKEMCNSIFRANKGTATTAETCTTRCRSEPKSTKSRETLKKYQTININM